MPLVRVVAAIIRREQKLLITQRRGHSHLGGLWEFPGGKVEPGESLEQALVREIAEEIGVTIQVGSEFFQVEHHYPTRSVRLHFFECTITGGEPQVIEVAALRWVGAEELHEFQFPEADRELIERLRTIS